MLEILKDYLHRAQQKMIEAANANQSDISFEVDDWVYVKLRPYRQLSLFFQTHPKLVPRVIGPFQMLAKVGKVAYRSALPENSGIHHVFHVSLLRKVVGHNLPIF